MQPHIETFTTRYHEMGCDRLLRVQCICNYMEEAAGVHADHLGVGLERLGRDNLAWVLAKMRLDVRRRPVAETAVRIETWPVAVERAQFRRDFLMLGPDGEVLAAAVTQWVVINTSTRRLGRFPGYVAGLQPEQPRLALEDGDIRIPAVGAEGVHGPVFPVRLADIDQNRHVNNGRYVDFALESADTAGAAGELRRLDIIFRAEGLRGDSIASACRREDEYPGSMVHSLFRQGDGTELARVRTVFG